MAAARGRGGTVVEDQRRPVKERRRRGPPSDEDAPLTCSTVPMRVSGELEGRENGGGSWGSEGGS